MVNFFGPPVCHCWHFILRVQFLSGAGLAKMRALVPVAERSQPVDAVPLCQSSATGKHWISSGRKKPLKTFWFPVLDKLRVNEVPLGAEILNLVIAVLGHSTANWMSMDYKCNGIPSNYHMNATRLSINCHLTAIWLPLYCHSTATRLSINCHLTVFWLPLDCHCNASRTVKYHWDYFTTNG